MYRYEYTNAKDTLYEKMTNEAIENKTYPFNLF
jgi:hypothetical protein